SYDNTGGLSASSWRHVKFVEQFAEAPPPAGGNGRLSLDVVAPYPPPANRWLMMSDVCKHCAAAPCQQACPTGAIVDNEFANVDIQPDVCTCSTWPRSPCWRRTSTRRCRACILGGAAGPPAPSSS